MVGGVSWLKEACSGRSDLGIDPYSLLAEPRMVCWIALSCDFEGKGRSSPGWTDLGGAAARI